MFVSNVPCEIEEMAAPVLLLVVVANTLGLMIGSVKPADALRKIALTFCLLVLLAALFGTLSHVWENLNFLQKMGVATMGVALMLWVIQRWRAPRKSKSKGTH